MLMPEDVLMLMVASIAHDVDHMGLNNSFHFRAETPLGILSARTGASSVLEVHHCNIALEVLSCPEADVFAVLPSELAQELVKGLIDLVLATDMARHKEMVATWTASLVDCPYDPSMVHQRRLLIQLLLCSADISNIAKPFPICRRWALRVTEEFHAQGDTELSMLGKTSAPIFDRAQFSHLAQGQLGFIDYVGIEHFSLLAKVVPGTSFALSQLQRNRAQWADVLQQQQQQQTPTGTAPSPVEQPSK